MDVKKIDGINELMLGGRELRTTESKEENLPTEIANSAKKYKTVELKYTEPPKIDDGSFFSKRPVLSIASVLLFGLAIFSVSKNIKNILRIKSPNSTGLTGLSGSAFKTGKKLNLNTITNVATGKQECLIMDSAIKIPADGMHFDISAYNKAGERIGMVRLKADPQNEFRHFIGELDKDSLYIDFFATSPKYKGVGKEMLRRIVHISKNNGYGGRVTLQACTGSIPSEFKTVCGSEKIQDVSCAIKYKKMGFNATNPEIDEKINMAILNGESGFVSSSNSIRRNRKRDTLTAFMELSLEAIKKYLG